MHNPVRPLTLGVVKWKEDMDVPGPGKYDPMTNSFDANTYDRDLDEEPMDDKGTMPFRSKVD